MPIDNIVVGTLGQWAAPFITFGLSFLKSTPKKQTTIEVESEVKKIIAHLGGKRVFLLKCIELRSGHPDYPETYSSAIANLSGSGPGNGWDVAARYACDFLSLLNLTEYRGSEVVISPLGRALLSSDIVRAEYAAFLQQAIAHESQSHTNR